MQTAGSASLIGRAVELSALETWLIEVAAGRAGLGLIEGVAGIGKTRLADAVCRIAAGLSFDVFAAAADELERGRPFGVVSDALGVALRAPAEAAAVPGLEYRVVDQLVERIEAAALQRPAAVVVEDLHWADPATFVALRAVGRRLAHLPIALLGTYRPAPQLPELELLTKVWHDEGALHLVLEPLEHRCVIELAAELAGASPGPELERQLSSAAGHPLFVTELLGALADDGAIALADGVAEITGRSLPPSLGLTILRRLGSLGDSTLSLLRTASALGTTFSALDLATVTARPAAGVVDELLEARRAGVVEGAGAMLRFRHDLVRDALYTDLPEAARRALHRHAGKLLAEAGAPKLQVAEQLSLGASPGDGEPVRWLRDAACESLLRAPQTAVPLLERAAELTPVTDPVRDQVLAELAEGLIWCGRPTEGQSLAADLLARGVPEPTREQARHTVVRGLWLEGRWQLLLEQIDRWFQTDPGPPDAVRGRWLADAAMAALFTGDAVRAEAMALEALAIGEALADDTVVFQSLYALGPIHNFRGRKDQELAVTLRALAITERGENPDLVRFQPHFALAMAFIGQDRHDDAEQAFMTGMRIREELGTVWDLPLYQGGLAELHCQMGKWDDALDEADTALAIAEEVGTRIRVLTCAGVAALIQAHRDDLAAADRYLAVAARELDRAGRAPEGYWMTLATAQLAGARGDRDKALRVLHDAWIANEHSAGLRVYLAPTIVRAALLARDPQLARSIADGVEAYEQPGSVASARANVLLARGTVDRDRATLERAADAFRELGLPHELGIACETTAAVIAEQQDAASARPLFDEAVDIYARLDARRDTARTLATMRACGLRRGSRAAHRRALKGWESLTAMETDVVRLTVDGLTNRQIGERLFISRRTVQTHLAHAFTKLDVASRVELAAAAQRHASA